MEKRRPKGSDEFSRKFGARGFGPAARAQLFYCYPVGFGVLGAAFGNREERSHVLEVAFATVDEAFAAFCCCIGHIGGWLVGGGLAADPMSGNPSVFRFRFHGD